jgi:Domain of unknown function (DUF1772)
MNPLIIVNDLVLFLCASMYLGTGWSLVLFQFPSRPQMTVESYYNQFVPQVTRATKFFTWMTVVMIATVAVMLIAEWNSWRILAPILVAGGILAATGLTIRWILPLNKQLAAGVSEIGELQALLKRWMALNTVRVGLWTLQWLALAVYFGERLR